MVRAKVKQRGFCSRIYGGAGHTHMGCYRSVEDNGTAIFDHAVTSCLNSEISAFYICVELLVKMFFRDCFNRRKLTNTGIHKYYIELRRYLLYFFSQVADIAQVTGVRIK